ncbi:ejaculatory bulb-specific protein 3-like [Euwallacea fornicatus]|uniref:ejaculatory bulb-specific protein 3-like n=1 Tax=Euwallacea fornicatus TaxID=995702 RepID=UPI00338DF99D
MVKLIKIHLHVTLLVVCLTLISLAKGYAAAELTTRPAISDEALEKSLTDKRYLQRQLKCALGEAACDPVGRRLKSLAPLVLRGACPQCSDQEKKQIKKVLAYVQVNFPKEWNKMLQTYSSG